MSSRLDRLVLLLDTGSSQLIRQTAAQQIGLIIKHHPEDTFNILERVLVHTRAKSWETRVAASKAIEAIAIHTPQWDPSYIDTLSSNSVENEMTSDGLLTFDNFDISLVLKKGVLLMSSEGKEFDTSDMSKMDPKERISLLKKQLKQKLGLGTEFMNMEDIFNENDINLTITSSGNQSKAQNYVQAQTMLNEFSAKVDVNMDGLSARERNQLKRKMKLEKNKRKSISVTALTPSSSKKLKTSAFEDDIDLSDEETVKIESSTQFQSTLSSSKTKQIVIAPKPQLKEDKLSISSSVDEWIFEGLCEILSLDLFSPQWEIRHGAALSLLQIIKVHGKGAGKISGVSRSTNAKYHKIWLQDLSIRLLCVLALDRFADFVSDQVVVPVRETCAQCLGVVLQYCDFDTCSLVIEKGIFVLLKTDLNAWEVRLAGLIGLKYFLAIRKDMVEKLLTKKRKSPVLEAIVHGLEDLNDDIRAVASSAMIPVYKLFLQFLSPEVVYDTLVVTLWNCLKDLDDLSSSTSSVMDLFSLFLMDGAINDIMRTKEISLSNLVPYMFPFFRHTISSVRTSVLKTILTLTRISESQTDWLSMNLLQLVWQNLFLEESTEIVNLSFDLWNGLFTLISTNKSMKDSVIKNLDIFLSLIKTPVGTALDEKLFLGINDGSGIASHDKLMARQELSLVDEGVVYHGRILACSALGILLSLYHVSMFDHYLLTLLESGIGYNRIVACIVIQNIVKKERQIEENQTLAAYKHLYDKILSTLNDYSDGSKVLLFKEMTTRLYSLRNEVLKTCAELTSLGASVPHVPNMPGQQELSTPIGKIFTLHSAKEFLEKFIPPNFPIARLNTEILHYSESSLQTETRIFSTYACALSQFNTLPPKLNALIKSLMNALKVENIAYFQDRAAESLAMIIDMNYQAQKLQVNEKLIKNIGALLCVDVTVCDVQSRSILSISGFNAEPEISKKKNTSSSVNSLNMDAESTMVVKCTFLESEQQIIVEKNRITKRGADKAFRHLCLRFENLLFDKCTKLFDLISTPLLESKSDTSEETKSILDALFISSTIAPYINTALHSHLESLLLPICNLLKNSDSNIRYYASTCLASLASVVTNQTMQVIIEHVLPLAGDAQNLFARKGVAECIFNLVNNNDSAILPYIVFLIVPVLSRMSDSDEEIRYISTNIFAQLVKVIPLESGIPDPHDIPEHLIKQRIEERKFLGQLVGTEKVDSFELPSGIKADLRPYQKEGVSWLAFLRRYGLHGILCDDMGLGKTLQSICILAADHKDAQKVRVSDVLGSSHVQSLVICPTSLCHHWFDEISKYAPFLKPLLCVGVPATRDLIRKKHPEADVIILSYDSVRNDLELLQTRLYNYIILDEGHIIKNPKTRISKSIKSLKAMKRLILSGTPIQNNVLELWSLFDFLMPGFLGTERQFNEKFGKSISASKDAKASSKEQERGALALESLHRQVLPFILRRLKEDVLDDLPPKIIQDYDCELSPLQKLIYESFSSSQETGESAMNGFTSNNVFQSLQYLRKVVNHPALVANSEHKMSNLIKTFLEKDKSNIMDLKHAPKMAALKQLLLDCGIGSDDANQEVSVVAPHRALIFCQLKSMVDILEVQLFNKHMPNVSYRRLDGTVPQEKRYTIVKNFNADPSIDVLLLTTHVGGLGLNLTGADTVIFFEHDWNPMKDLQAMDRAHRIGQKRVVNVYRLITKNTLEEKIMGLQKFKMNIASSIINQDNSGLKGMNSEQILDLFSTESDDKGKKKTHDESKKKLTTKEVLEGLEEIYDDRIDTLDEFLAQINTV